MESNPDDVRKDFLEAPPLPSNYQCYASLKTLTTILKRADMEILLQQMEHSIFHPFLKQLHDLVKEGHKMSTFECSSILMFCLGKRFNVADNTITIGNVSIKLCANEVARILGIPNEGINIDGEFPIKENEKNIAADDEKEAKNFFSRLQRHCHPMNEREKDKEEGKGQSEPSRGQSDKKDIDGEKNEDEVNKATTKKGVEAIDGEKNEDEVNKATTKKGVEAKLSRSTLTNILEKMHVDVQNAESKKEFLEVFKYFLVECFLLVSADKTCRMKTYKYVQDLDSFEKINWALATLNGIQEAAKKVATSNSCFTGCAPVLEALLYEKVEVMRPDLRKGGDTLLPILRYNSKRLTYKTVWPVLQNLTINDIKIWECNGCNTCEVKSLISQEVKSLETRGPRFPKTRDVDVVNEYSAQVAKVCGDAYVQVSIQHAIEQARGQNEELGRYMSSYGPQKIADFLKTDLKADNSWKLLEKLSDNLLESGNEGPGASVQHVSVDDESAASDIFETDWKANISSCSAASEAPAASAAISVPDVPTATVAPAATAASIPAAREQKESKEVNLKDNEAKKNEGEEKQKTEATKVPRRSTRQIKQAASGAPAASAASISAAREQKESMQVNLKDNEAKKNKGEEEQVKKKQKTVATRRSARHQAKSTT